VIAIGLLGASSSSAGTLGLSLQCVLASSPSTGDSFEVDLTNSTGNAVVVNSFFFGFTANANFIFTSATTATTNSTYIFDGIGNSLYAPDITSTAGAGFISAGDLWVGLGNGFNIADGATVGLGEVFFNVAAGVAPGPYTVSFVTDQTSLSDINGANIPIGSFNSGTITVPGGEAAPEPTTLALFAAPALLLLLARKHHAPLRG
jgi:hypothetical protein